MEIKSKEIKIVPVKSLSVRKKNRNHHPQDQIEMLAEHFKYQGFRNPLIISNQSGEIVCGNGRLLAAIRAGLKEVPVIYQDFDSDAQEYAYHVADNGLNLWSELDIAGINADLPDLGPNFDIDSLGLKNFTLDFNDKEFDPNSDDEETDDKKVKRCPNCNEII